MVAGIRLDGMHVITADAYLLGEVEGTEIDTTEWKVTHLRVALSEEAVEEFGLKKPFLSSIRICLPTSYVNKFGNVVTLKADLQALKGIPECKTDATA